MLETHETLEEFVEDKGKNKANGGEGSQQEETHNTLHLKFSPREIVAEPTKKNEKAIILEYGITINWANLTWALIQIIKNLEGKIDPANKIVLGTRATSEGRADLEVGAKQKQMQELRLAAKSMSYV